MAELIVVGKPERKKNSSYIMTISVTNPSGPKDPFWTIS